MTEAAGSVADAVKQTIDTTTIPAGVAVSGLTLFGVPLSQWVFIGTAFLLACKITLTVPKVYRLIRRTLAVLTEARR